MGRNKTLNYADFGNSNGQGQGSNRGAQSSRGNSNGIFSRLGANTNSFQPLADQPTAPGRIAFGGRANSSQKQSSVGQGPQQHRAQQQTFPPNRVQHRSIDSPAQGRSQQHKTPSVQSIIVEGITEHMNKRWPLTCYAAVTDKVTELRNAPNEVTGDVSFEEVHWADCQEANKQSCIARFNTACQAKLAQFQALQQCRTPPSQGGPPVAEPHSPYIANPPAAASAGMHSFGMPSHTTLGQSQNPVGVKQNPFGQASRFGQALNPFGGTAASAQPFGQASNPFGGTAASAQPFGQAANPFGGTSASAQSFGQATSQQQASQPGRIQFGQKARTQASTQQQPEKPFQRPSQPTGDPFGRQRPAQAMQAAHPSSVPAAAQPLFGEPAQQQQQLPGTPAPFAAFGGPMQAQQHAGAGDGRDTLFQTPAAQQPAFSGGIAASPETPAAGKQVSAAQQPVVTTQPAVNVQGSGLQSNAWTLEEFEIGKIPEEPPPPMYCQA